MKYAITLLIKDEEEYLDEWIQYHTNLGFQYFYIFDNMSKIPISPRENCQIIRWDNDTIANQTSAYNHAAMLGRNDNIDFMAFIDTDEFIILDRSLFDLYKIIGDNSGVGLNWLMYGTSFLKNKQNSILQNFILSSENNYEPNKHIKIIIKPKDLIEFITPHYANTKKGIVNINKQKISHSLTNIILHDCRINHYFTRSQGEFKKKCERGRGDKVGGRDINELQQYEIDLNVVKREPIYLENIIC